jgi:hypothetical protein
MKNSAQIIAENRAWVEETFAKVDAKLRKMAVRSCGLAADGKTTIRDAECVDISYPSFFSDLSSLTL